MEIDLGQAMTALRRWGWLMLLAALVCGSMAFVLARAQSPTYSATTTLLVNPQQITSTAENSVLEGTQSQAQTYVRLVESGPVMDRVIHELKLPYTRSQLSEKTDARVVMNTQLIEVTVTDASPEAAARIANEVAAQFEAHVESLTIGRLKENLMQIEQERSTLQLRQSEIDSKLEELAGDENSDDPEIQKQLNDLEEERARVQETIADLDSSIRSINGAIVTVTSPIEVADEALAAREPDAPKPVLMGALGGFLGLILGAGMVTCIAVSDDKLRPETNVEDLTGKGVLVSVPLALDRPSGKPFTLADPDGKSSEAIRMLRTRIMSAVRGSGNAVVMFSSAGGTDRSSEVVANLGVVMSQVAVETVLVNANMRCARLHQVFGTEYGPERSSSRIPVDPDVENSGVQHIGPKLRLWTPGSVEAISPDFIVSNRFRECIDSLRATADIVLIDAPPMHQYSDAAAVASMSDGVILVAKYGSTSREHMTQVSETLGHLDVRLLGTVVVTG